MNVHLRLRGRTPPWVQLSDSYRLILPLQKIPMFTPSTSVSWLLLSLHPFFQLHWVLHKWQRRTQIRSGRKTEILTQKWPLFAIDKPNMSISPEAICGFIIKFFFFIHRKLTHAFKERIQVKSKIFVLKISLPTWLPLLHSLSLCPLFPFVPGPSGVIYSIVLL